MHQIYELLEQKKETMYGYLKEIVEKESHSYDKESLDMLANWIAATFEELTGGKAEIISNDQYGNHVRGEFGEGDGQILILAHFDTVWPKGTLEKIPFQMTDGIARGPGVFDMKGGLIQGLFALHALQDLGQTLDKKVVLFFDSDEEIGNPSSKELIEKEASKSDVVFVLEPGMSKLGCLKTSRKGVGIFTIEVTGVPSHAGIDPEAGKSAIEELAHQTLYLHSLTDLELGTTLNVGKITAGTASNVVAEKAYAEVDLRVKTKEEYERVLPLILNLQPKIEGVKVEVTGGINRWPLERTEQVAEMFEKAKQIAESSLGFELTEMETGGGSDGNLTAPFAPTLDGLGAVGDGAHANHEYLVLDKMTERSALLALLLLEYGRDKEE
ncbi:M20 family metallopeptidase [Sporosarcina koreensis]|uniref:M20 family metallopeptidase n=1 Tax=Sporosarcina koreensis TaxID=334735 RepID=A0ABW0U0B8_9BACL